MSESKKFGGEVKSIDNTNLDTHQESQTITNEVKTVPDIMKFEGDKKIENLYSQEKFECKRPTGEINNGIVKMEYDKHGNITQIETELSGTDEDGKPYAEELSVAWIYDNVYDENDKLTEIRKKDKDNELVYTSKYSYNDGEKKTTQTDVDKDGNIVSITDNYYDDDGNLIKYESKGKDGKINHATTFSYEDGKLIKSTGGDRETNFSYDKQGRRTKTESTDGDVNQYFYDEQNRLVKSIREYEDDDGKTISTSEFSY